MVATEHLIKKLAEDLSRERVITPQVQEYIINQYGVNLEEFPSFFADRVPTLEDYELDLVFSPLFTPTLSDRAGYGVILGHEALGSDEVRGLIETLAQKPVYAHFLTGHRQNIPMALQEVTIERFVDRLYLDRPLSEGLNALIGEAVPMALQGELRMLARESVWQGSWRQDLLAAFLQLFHLQQSVSLEKVLFLTDFVRTYRPGNLNDLQRQLDSMIQSCKQDLDNVQGRSFHDAHLKEMYADTEAFNAAAQAEAQAVSQNYQQMIVMAEALLNDYWTMRERIPEVVKELNLSLQQS
jgi:hypothetical protein